MNNNDKSHGMLEMWLALQRAVGEFSRRNQIPLNSVVPWECQDERVREVWEKLTRPDNLKSLEEWLEAEKANDQRVGWTEAAIKLSRERS